MNDSGPQPSSIKLVDVTNGRPFPSAPAGSVLVSSMPLGWRGIIVERHRLEPQDLPEHYVVGHGLTVSTGKRPISFHWKDGGRWRKGILNPGEFHLLADGDLNAPGWSQTFEELSLVLNPRCVADTLGDAMPARAVEFSSQRSVHDAIVAFYADAFSSELFTDSPNGLLYVETLTVGLVLHLLSNYAVAKPRIPLPRGKLNHFQLRRVVDFILSHLNEDVSLLALAEQANVSPFHFARLFRATLRLTPHQFVLRQRIQKSVNLIKIGKLPLAQIAVESGFYDQAHLTHAFQKLLGTTPALYSPNRNRH